MKPILPPPHAVMPRPIATDPTKAIEARPILLNFMRFLNLAVIGRQSLSFASNSCGDYKCSAYCRSYGDFAPLSDCIPTIHNEFAGRCPTASRSVPERKDPGRSLDPFFHCQTSYQT